MDKDFLTSINEKTTDNATPFDRIADLEKAENERVEKEYAGFKKEKDEVARSIMEKEIKEEERLHAESDEEVKKYGMEEGAIILKNADDETQRDISEIENKAKERFKEAEDIVLNAFLSS